MLRIYCVRSTFASVSKIQAMHQHLSFSVHSEKYKMDRRGAERSAKILSRAFGQVLAESYFASTETSKNVRDSFNVPNWIIFSYVETTKEEKVCLHETLLTRAAEDGSYNYEQQVHRHDHDKSNENEHEY